MQTYFRLSLVSTENNVCEPEPGNDFCDVMTFVSPWPIRFHDRKKLECSSQRIPRAVVLGLLQLNCDWLKIPTSQKSFPGSGSQTLFLVETSDSRKYVCVPRLVDPRLKKETLQFSLVKLVTRLLSRENRSQERVYLLSWLQWLLA